MTSPTNITEEIKQARGKFIAMAATYSLGVFNDNFFKQAACLLAVSVGLARLQGDAGVLFTVPFILLAAPAGWLSDRFPKRNIVIAAKLLEVVAMTCGAIGVCTENWTLILIMVFTMGLHSTIFSPALNGSIPELYPASYVLKANSIMKMVTTTAILVGIILAGMALSVKSSGPGGIPMGRFIVAASVLAVAAGGLLASLKTPRRPAASPGAKFPWTGPIDTIRVVWGIRKDRLLNIVIWTDAYVWLVAALLVFVINKTGMEQLHLDELRTSYLVVAELAGVGAGGFLCGRLASSGRWFRILPPAAMLLAAGCLGVTLVPKLASHAAVFGVSANPQMIAIVVCLVLAGLGGGLLLVPLESFIQSRPAPEHKGQIIAAANFTAFSGIAIAALLFLLIDPLTTSVPGGRSLHPTTAFAFIGAPTALVGVLLAAALRKEDGR